MRRGELEEKTYLALKKVAIYYMCGERGGHTLSPTALVNEAYLKFHASNHENTELQFKHVAARNMRQILVYWNKLCSHMSRLTKALHICHKFHLIMVSGNLFDIGVQFNQPPLREPVICPATALQLLKRE